MKRIILVLISSLLILLLFASFFFKAEKRAELKMGTIVDIQLIGPRWLDFDKAFEAAFAAVDSVEKTANMYDEESELSRLNNGAAISRMPVSDELFEIIKSSMYVSKTTGGAFDITVAPLVRLWKSYERSGSIPGGDEINNTLPVIGYKNIILNGSNKSVRLSRKGVLIDLSAVAKGYAADKAIEALQECGFRSAVVNAGGEIYCLGKRGLSGSWRIGIQDPKDKDNILDVIYLRDKAVATSGGYEQNYLYNGKYYTHLIDPKTGYPIESVFSSATVIAPTCMLADAMATAASVAGKKRAEDFAQKISGINIMVRE